MPASSKPAKPAEPEDEQHRKFREALERKRAAEHEAPVHAARNKGVGEAHNDHNRRQFRRKSGS
jgi:hypothetical protein